jgi:multicomponent Na+:H+ antiporter subunit F
MLQTPTRFGANTKSFISGIRREYFLEKRGRFHVHQIVFYFAAVWMTGLLAVSVAAVIGVRSTAGRILALDLLTLILVALLVLYSDTTLSPHYLDAALILSILAFVGTVAAARYHGERKIF